MKKEVIYTQKNLYRADMNIYGYHFCLLYTSDAADE